MIERSPSGDEPGRFTADLDPGTRVAMPRVRWRIVPAALSAVLGALVVLFSCLGLIRSHDEAVMRQELRRGMPARNETPADRFVIRLENENWTKDVVKTSIQIPSGVVGIAAARFWMMGKWRFAIALSAAMVVLLLASAIFPGVLIRLCGLEATWMK